MLPGVKPGITFIPARGNFLPYFLMHNCGKRHRYWPSVSTAWGWNVVPGWHWWQTLTLISSASFLPANTPAWCRSHFPQ